MIWIKNKKFSKVFLWDILNVSFSICFLSSCFFNFFYLPKITLERESICSCLDGKKGTMSLLRSVQGIILLITNNINRLQEWILLKELWEEIKFFFPSSHLHAKAPYFKMCTPKPDWEVLLFHRIILLLSIIYSVFFVAPIAEKKKFLLKVMNENNKKWPWRIFRIRGGSSSKKKKKLWEISFLMGESCNQKPKVGGEYYLSA